MKDTGKEAPYLSVVIVSRNDEHSEKMLRRTELSVCGIIAQLERYRVPSEFILVEWLPPANRPLLKDALQWPKKTDYCKVRAIIVTPSAVGDYDYSEDYSIRDLTPWNVGIRRSTGNFVLSTVADTLLSDELVLFLSQRKLDKNAMYRIDRCDVNRKVMDLDTLDEQLTYCKRNIICMCTPYPFESFIKKTILKKKLPILHNYSPGDFMLFSRERWNLIRGFPEGMSPGGDNVLLYMAHLSGAKEQVFKKPMRLYHIDHDSIWQKPSFVFFRRFFTLIKIPHSLVGILADIGSRLVFSKSYLEKNNFMRNTRKKTYKLVVDMVEGRRPYIYNDENWGLGDQELKEF